MRRRAGIERALRKIAPRIPRHEFAVVTERALDSRGLRKAAPETAAWLSLVAYIRHTRTEYDALLLEGYDPESARHFVREGMNAVLAEWGVERVIASE